MVQVLQLEQAHGHVDDGCVNVYAREISCRTSGVDIRSTSAASALTAGAAVARLRKRYSTISAASCHGPQAKESQPTRRGPIGVSDGVSVERQQAAKVGRMSHSSLAATSEPVTTSYRRLPVAGPPYRLQRSKRGKPSNLSRTSAVPKPSSEGQN